MPGTFIFRPIEAELQKDKGLIHKMDSYCRIKIGKHKSKSRVCKEGGVHPHWDDAVIVQRDHETIAVLKIKDNNLLNPHRKVGVSTIDLREVEKEGQVNKWYPLYSKGVEQGKVNIEITYTDCVLATQEVNLVDEKPHGEYHHMNSWR